MSGRVQFIYIVRPDDADRSSLLAGQQRVGEIAEGMALPCRLDGVPGDGPLPYLDLIVSVADERVVAWVEATRERPPTSEVLCENDLQALALSSLGLPTEVCLTGEQEEWEADPRGASEMDRLLQAQRRATMLGRTKLAALAKQCLLALAMESTTLGELDSITDEDPDLS